MNDGTQPIGSNAFASPVVARPPGDDSGGYDALGSREGLLRPGTLVAGGTLRIVHDIGGGAMSTVYEATDLASGRNVALKVLGGKYAARADAEPRLFAEAKYARVLGDHPNIVRPLGWGNLPEAENAAFLVSELVEGPQLSSLCGDPTVPAAQAVELLRDLAAVLAELHRAGVVHRDVKPTNVLLERRGGRTIVKLLDFGLATTLDAAPRGAPEALTGANDRPGTKHYMAPEQCVGMPAAPAMDVYALGVLAYELYRGQPPMGAEDPVEVVMRKCNAALPSFSLTALALPWVPIEIGEIVDRALRHSPVERPTAAQLRDELTAVLERLSKGGADRVVDATAPGGQPDPRELRAVSSGRISAALDDRETAVIERAPEDRETMVVERPVTSPPLPVPVVHTELARAPRAELLLRIHRVGLDVRAVPALGPAREDGRRRARFLPVAVVAAMALAFGVWWMLHGRAVDVAPSETAPAAIVRDEAVPAIDADPVAAPAALAPPEAPAPSPGPLHVAPAFDDAPEPSARPSERPRDVPSTPRPRAPKLDAAATRRCVLARNDAAESARNGDFRAALRELEHVECWTDKRAYRRALVRALTQTKQYRRCIDAARGSHDAAVREQAEVCAAMVDEG